MKESKPVKRVVELDETSWKWLCEWMGNLLKTIRLDEMNPDTLRMGAILRDLEQAKRANISDTKEE
jgi:hypothetical protein